jgi:hypothetical protein
VAKSKADLNIVKIPASKKNQGESSTQKVFFRWLELAMPLVRPFVFAVPNGGSRHKAEAVALKKQGVTAGVPDVFCALPNQLYSGLFIEFKYGKNKLTKLQQEFIIRLRQAGYCAEVCYSFEEAQKLILEYLDEVDLD